MSTILLIEDDQSLGLNLKKLLEQEGFSVYWASNLAESKPLMTNNVNIIVLDWMLPDGHGIDYLKSLRDKNNNIPVIMLTARVDLIDKVIGLETGANDYMTKPFESRELIARIRVQLRNTHNKNDENTNFKVISINGLKINLTSREVFYYQKKIELTKMEFELLTLLASNPNRVFPREELLNKVWGYENYPTTRTVDTHVLLLRQKINENIIETKRGVGYSFKK